MGTIDEKLADKERLLSWYVEKWHALTRENERLTAQLTQAREIIDSLRAGDNHIKLERWTRIREWRAKEFLAAHPTGRFEAMEKALEFYADPDTYNKDLNGPNESFVCAVDRDEGNLARAALKGVKSDEHQ